MFAYYSEKIQPARAIITITQSLESHKFVNVLSSMANEFDVVIVGAGLSGLVAANELQRKCPSMTFRLIEALDRVGGQICSSACPMRGELGARWISADQKHIHGLCTELGIQLEPVQHRAATIDDASQLRRDWDIDCGPFARLVRWELTRFVQYVDDLALDYHPDSAVVRNQRWTGGGSMDAFIRGQLLFGASRDFIRLCVRYVSGCAAADITFVEYMQLCNGAEGISNHLKR